MENKIAYENWPEWTKLMTAFRLKSITIKEPGVATGVSIVNIAIGVFFFIPALYSFGYKNNISEVSSLDFWSIYIAALNLVIGIFNLVITKNAIAWIKENSLWEERDKHTSANKYKFLYVLMMLGIFIVPWLIACWITC
ncbi:MAG: hypothetical protein AAGJ18_03125 [Bacteroidota bacterium]